MLFYLLTFLSQTFAQWAAQVAPAEAKPVTPTTLTASQLLVKNLWLTMIVDMTHVGEVTQAAATILANKARYEKVGQPFGIPFWVIGCLHMRESSFDFMTHLANGDQLFDAQGKPAKTSHAPVGMGPYADWESAAIGAIVHEGLDKLSGWHLYASLDRLERYNGLGYRNKGLNSPYLWSMTNHYSTGKYAFDGMYDGALVDKQIGCAAVLLALKGDGILVDDV